MSSRSAILMAAAAVGGAFVLLGGPATYASWSDSEASETTTIAAGDLRAEIAQSEPTSVAAGEANGVFPANDSQGIIPGAQAQRWTYTVTNSSDSNVEAVATLQLRGAVQNAEDYEAVRHYLQGELSVDGQALPESETEIAFGVDGFTHDVDLGAQLAPGESVPVALTLSMPATVIADDGRTVDVAVEVQNRRSDSTSKLPIFTMENSVLLEQAAIS